LYVVTDVAGATSGEFELDDVQFSAAPVLALAVYSPRTITIPPGGSISENTLVQIVHTPLPALPLPPAR
jgi:hypothetical protein